jgi:uncharacterized protein (TIGR02145 family)
MFNQKYFMLVTCCFLLPAQTIFSQIVLQGTVTDNGGEYLGSGAEPIVKALVSVTDQADPGRTFSTSTDEQGQYTIQITQTGVDDPSATPSHFRLLQNYPNPFNPSTVIGYELSQPCRVTIDIYNVLGRKVKTLLDGFQSSSGQVVWYAEDANSQGVPAGLYICSMKAGDVRINKKMLLIDGQQGNAPAASVVQARSAITGNVALNKQMSDQYILQVTGDDIAVYEQQNLEITSNTTVNVTVTRTVTDIDGNVYRTVKIGDQWWMAENLKVTHYRNGDAIPNVTDNTEWPNLATGACCSYNNAPDSAATWGCLYNWYAVNDTRNIVPAGWHVPTDAEWKVLVDYLGGYSDAGGKMKETGTSHWVDPNIGATNGSGLNALPGGYRNYYGGNFNDLGLYAFFWSSTEYDTGLAWYRYLDSVSSGAYQIYNNQQYGYSVRLVRDH